MTTVQTNTKYLYTYIVSTATPKGQPRQVNPYGKVVYRGITLGTNLAQVNGLPLCNLLVGEGNRIAGWTGTFAPVAAAEEIARRRLVLKLRANTASWGLSLLEYKQTMQMVGHILKLVHSPVRTLAELTVRYSKAARRKSGGPNMRETLTTDLIGGHLAYKFGVAPLMADLKSTIEFLETQKQLRCQIVASSGKRPYACAMYDANPDYRIFQSMQGETRCRSGASFVLTNEALFMAESMGLYNLPAILLDAVPLSFVVNWFFPIVNWAKDLSSLAGVTPEGAWTTTRREGIGEDRWAPNYQKGYGYKVECFYMRRRLELVSSMPFPKSIKVVDDPEFKKIFTSVELAAQRLIPLLEILRRGH